MLNLTWQVVAGEESKEVEDQCQREMRVLEAIYPRPSSIPPKFESFLILCNNFYRILSCHVIIIIIIFLAAHLCQWMLKLLIALMAKLP